MEYKDLYLLMLPAFVCFLLFKYLPLYGTQLAFKTMKIGQTIEQARWVQWQNFERFFTTGYFHRTLYNTLKLGITSQLLFPLPVMLAVLLHNCVVKPIKVATQTVTYLPNLISVAVTMSIVFLFCSDSTGFLNIIRRISGLEEISFFGNDEYVLPMYLISAVWSTTGYNAVIYLAALSGVSPELTEAATIDGCTKFKRIFYVDLPTIRPIIVITLIMSIGSFLTVSTEKLLMIQTDMNIAASESIGTYTYKLGMLNRQYGYSTAVDLFTNVVNFSLLMIANSIARVTSETSLF